jgi:hypothetical protein
MLSESIIGGQTAGYNLRTMTARPRGTTSPVSEPWPDGATHCSGPMSGLMFYLFDTSGIEDDAHGAAG